MSKSCNNTRINVSNHAGIERREESQFVTCLFRNLKTQILALNSKLALVAIQDLDSKLHSLETLFNLWVVDCTDLGYSLDVTLQDGNVLVEA